MDKEKNKVEIYTTPSCPYCVMAKEYFKKNGISYSEYDVSSDIARQQELINMTHQYGVPVIVIDGKPILGFDRPKIDQMLGL